MQKKHQPERTCVGCRAKKPKSSLLRIVRTTSQTLVVDLPATKPGRGVYLCFDENCLTLALRKKAFYNHLNVQITQALISQIADAIHAR